MASFKIDNTAMTNPPSHIQIIYPELVSYPGPGLGKIVVQPMTPPTIEVRWGMDAVKRAVVDELITARATKMVHVASWTDETETRFKHRTVAIPPIGYGQGPTMGYVDTFTLRMEQIMPMPSLNIIELFYPGTIGTGDGKVKYKTPAGGTILKIDGFIGTLGSGGGTSTDVQVSNGATDYLSTKGTFEVDSATGLMENQVLGTTLTFNRGATIELDCDAVSTNPGNVQVLVYALMFAV